jgi:hypothetical protein
MPAMSGFTSIGKINKKPIPLIRDEQLDTSNGSACRFGTHRDFRPFK